MVPALVMLPLLEARITMIAVTGISHLVIMFFPGDVPVGFIQHLI
jgi:hypothetical protein